ncbi:OpgC domain-containing protein [Methylocystis sp. L43]|uniref:OpgC domain-containing protein n=1 Tax=unclassified Methylocystis TaxID=2625913 RepID=UPI0018C1FFD4|nr:OpgC domain-containing protein [Methylocystis sp. L43]MBG0806809.1 OpgC domain-containing protein [Methylocystis sp. H15]
MPGERIESIDFWRGAVLAAIFVNHMPGNILGYLTPRNYGFSDAAEAFVFLSGLSVALAYGRRFKTAPKWTASAPLLSRAMRLYAAHLGLTAIALALFGAATLLTGQEQFLAEHGRSAPFLDPLRGLVGVATLGHQIGYFNILPLYVALLLFAPLLCLVGLRNRWRMLLLSAGIYAVARFTGANLPSWPEPGVWFFNPMTWQLMFALGIFTGLVIRDGKFAMHAGTYRLALTFTLGAALIVSNFIGFIPEFADVAVAHLDRGKTELGVIRIVDFLALAYVLYCSRASAKLKATAIFSATSLLGRHSLVIFSAGSLLSVIGQILNATAINSPFFDVIFVLAGLWTLYKLASFLECRHRTPPLAATAAPADFVQAEELSFTR